jgi:GxxExxY protein
MTELIHPELSYKIIGCCLNVYNTLGGGYQEKVYQSAVSRELANSKISFLEQIKADIFYRNNKIHRYFLDFIVDNKIVLELKVSPRFNSKDIIQALNYLKQTNLQLGILVSFHRDAFFYKRVLRGRPNP